ncbi:MAG: hypothetical protein IJM23_08270 [Lachnospiraceae bacterium]|nr:hypothetical protein [Lachnospiraceae bacterium]
MSGIVLDGRRIIAYERLGQLCAYTGKDETYLSALWMELIPDADLMTDFMYYLDHHSFCNKTVCRGYSLTDLYFYKIRRYDVKRDAGKNNADCNKEALVLDTFMMMADMKKDPDKYINKLNDAMGQGMDLY